MSQQPPPPPPPPGGYGAPPPPPAGGYGGPPPGGEAWSVGNAVNYGWTKFQANMGSIIVAGIVVFVGIAVVEVIGYLIQRALADQGSLVLSLLGNGVVSLLFFLVFQLIGAGIIRGALDITEGRAFDFGASFKAVQLGPVVVTSLINSVIIFIGTLLCVIPGIIASFALSYSLYFVIDRGLEPMDAIKASVDLVKNRIGEALVWAIVAFVITLLGACLCGVGLIVAIPVSILGTAFTYKKLTGQAVAA